MTASENEANSSKRRNNCDCQTRFDSVKIPVNMQVDLTTDQIVPTCEISRFIAECLEAVGASMDAAVEQAGTFVENDVREHRGYGIRGLSDYICRIHEGVIDAGATPIVEKENESTALVDGRNGFGAPVANLCVDMAIEKAKKNGVAWICAYNSNDIGTLDVYSRRVAEEGLVGLCFTNGPPCVVPWGGREPMFGKNPLSVAAPLEDAEIYSMDMATCTVQEGQIKEKRTKGEPIPPGWYVDAGGSYITDPESTVQGFLTPLGTADDSTGFKGTVLALLVEILCGVSAGSNFGPFVPADRTKPANLGHCFVAFDPSCFASGFEKRLGTLLTAVRRSEPNDKKCSVRLPGDREKELVRSVQRQGGVRYSKSDLDIFAKLSATLGIDPPRNNHGIPASPTGAGGKVCYAKCSNR